MSDWNTWAQFVFGNGGPAPDRTDAEIQGFVCAAVDGEFQRGRAEGQREGREALRRVLAEALDSMDDSEVNDNQAWRRDVLNAVEAVLSLASPVASETTEAG
jgi:hypothetical protein